jgi:1-acyl-sn-glycerol-3-phosphate acyltransferase
MLRGILVRIVLVLASAALAAPAMLVALVVPPWGNVVVYAGKVWARILLATAGARVRFHGLEHVQGQRPCVYIANHVSMIDVWVMLTLVPPRTRFVAKQELFRIPVFGWALRAAGFIAVNRANRADAIRSLAEAAERIRAGRSVVLFPEGTRSRDGRLSPFKKGAFHLALSAGVPVVPVAITGSFQVMPAGTLRVTPGPVEVFIEPAVDVAPFAPSDYDGLLEKVHGAIARRFA